MAPRRQVEQGIRQCGDLTADDGYFATIGGPDRSPELADAATAAPSTRCATRS
jgi:hypothetical protein